MGVCKSTAVSNIKQIKVNYPKESMLETTLTFKQSITCCTYKKVKTSAEFIEEFKLMKLVKADNQNLEDYEMICNAFNSCSIFKSLNSEIKGSLAANMSLSFIGAGEYLFKQGAFGSCFYVVKSGKIDLISDDQCKEITRGGCFGEKSMICDRKLQLTAEVAEDSFIWCLERLVFKKLTGLSVNRTNDSKRIFCENVKLVSILSQEHKSLIINHLDLKEFNKGDMLASFNEKLSCLYIIKQGSVDIAYKSGSKISRNAYETIGEFEILNETSFQFSATASSDKVTCYSISVESLTEILGEDFKNEILLGYLKLAFHNSIYFSKINDCLIETIFQQLTVKSYQNHDIVVVKNFLASRKLIVVLYGNIVKSSDPNFVVESSPSVLFGENIFRGVNQMVLEPLEAFPECVILTGYVSKILQIIGCSFDQMVEQSKVLESLLQTSIFRNINLSKLEELSKKISIVTVNKEEIIYSEGEVSEELFILKSGCIDFFEQGTLMKTIRTENIVFGQHNLLLNKPRSATAKANEQSILYKIKKDQLLSIIDEKMKKYLIELTYLEDVSLDLKDLLYLSTLSKGAFSHLYLVESRTNQHKFAIKSFQKSSIDLEYLQSNIEEERRILSKINHPHIIKMIKVLKDDNHIFFLREYVRGKEMFEILQKIGSLSIEQTIFYSACLFLAADYLRKNNILHRNINQNSIIISFEGHLKLVGFKFAKELAKNKTRSLVGISHYIAPEILSGEGYSFQAEIWAIGVCMFEFATGYVPFADEEDDPIEVYLSIQNK